MLSIMKNKKLLCSVCCIERYFIGFYTLFFEIEEL